MTGFVLPTVVVGLSDDERDVLARLVDVWQQKLVRNSLRTEAYEGKSPVKDLGISVPPFLARVDTVVGWPAKAVDTLAAHSIFDGIAGPVDQDDPFGLRAVLNANNFKALYQQAVRSELTHSVAFWTVSYGDRSLGEPPVVISVRSAEWAAGIWSSRLKRIAAGMAVTDLDQGAFGQGTVPSEITLYLDDSTVILRADGSGWRVVERVEHGFGRPLMEPMPFKPSESRPFGRSRITREMLSITESAQRAALRAEVLMEFNTAPQKYLLGADEDTFAGGKWKAYLDEILAISKDEDGDLPVFGQLPQLTPKGAIDYYTHLAGRFASAASIPVSALGVTMERSDSSMAVREDKDELVKAAEELNQDNESVLGNVARMVLAVRDNIGWSDLPEDAWELVGAFRNAANPSIVSQSDAIVKQISAIPWLADTTVALQELGYTDTQIVRLLAEKRRANAGGLVERLAARAERPEPLAMAETEPVEKVEEVEL